MTTPDAPSPFARHQRTAEALLQTLEQALQPQFAQKGAIGRDDLARAVALIIRHEAALAPLFAENCRACLAQGAGPTAGRAAAIQADRRRRDHVTRLLFSAVTTRTPESVDPITGEVFPRILAAPLQSHLSALFYEKEWEAMNADALLALQKIGTDRDEEIWTRIGEDEALPIVIDAVFIRVLLRFRQFAFQRQNFIRRMGELLRDRRFVVTEDHFIMLFDSMFDRLRPGLASELSRALLDVRYGDETAVALLKIFDEFDKYRKDLALPVRSLAGPQKLMQGRRPAAAIGRH